jgi:hypothetical protein
MVKNSQVQYSGTAVTSLIKNYSENRLVLKLVNVISRFM